MKDHSKDSPIDLSDVAQEPPESSTSAEKNAVEAESVGDTSGPVPPDNEQ